MKKWKLFFVSIAIALGIGGAFATNKSRICEYYEQYVLVNGVYVSAGTYGIDYVCFNGPGICTFYKPTPSSPYYPCRTGEYYQIPSIKK